MSSLGRLEHRAPAGGPWPRRVLVESGSVTMSNVGDVAMTRETVARLAEAWPHAELGIPTTARDRLAAACPGVTALPQTGRWPWTAAAAATPAGRMLGGRFRNPRRERDAWRRLHHLGRRMQLSTRPERLAALPDEARALVEWWASADLVVVAGRGGLTDAMRADAHELLDILEATCAAGVPFALFSQGLGPLTGGLRRRAARVLPHAEVLGLREGRMGPQLAVALGVPADRVVVTGDDALPFAVRAARIPDAESHRIGVCVRVSSYSGIGPAAVHLVGAAVRRVLAGLPATGVAPIVIAEGDAETYRTLFGAEATCSPTDPQRTLDDVAGCRAVVTGAYHAAVFALAQGVPAVALVASDYYAAKFAGLEHAFGAGLRPVRVDAPGFAERLEVAVRRAWDEPAAFRQALRERAASVAATSDAAYEQLFRRAGAPTAAAVVST